MKNISAKDAAFEKERAKYRQKIRELEREIKDANTNHASETADLRETIRALEEKNRILEEWNKRLLAYMDLSEDDLKKVMAKDKTQEELYNRMNEIFSSSIFSARKGIF